MVKFLKSPNLLQRETPEELDRRILLAGAIAASRYRRNRRQAFIGALTGIAAAFAVAVICVHNMTGSARPESRRAAGTIAAVAVAPAGAKSEFSERELLEFSDWTTLEQENYNLASQLNCYQDVQDMGISS